MTHFSSDCHRCRRLARHLEKLRSQLPDYHARPVAPFGAANPQLLIVGLAPGMHGANRTGRPFTGDFAGVLLYETLHRYGYANRPTSVSRDDGLKLVDCRITNAVKCLPPKNKPAPAEVRGCNVYLRQEISELPRGAAILALGATAHRAVLLALELSPGKYRFRHGSRYALPPGHILYDSYHCSRYNTQTKRLTSKMFHAVFAKIVKDRKLSHPVVAHARSRSG